MSVIKANLKWIILVLGLIFLWVKFGSKLVSRIMAFFGTENNPASLALQATTFNGWSNKGNTPPNPAAAAVAQSILNTLESYTTPDSNCITAMYNYNPQCAADVYDVFIAFGSPSVQGNVKNLQQALNDALSNFISCNSDGSMSFFGSANLSQAQRFQADYITKFNIFDITITG